MWLYDFLPDYFENARIMTYGYKSSLLEPSGANPGLPVARLTPGRAMGADGRAP
jgi:hypothetical protein